MSSWLTYVALPVSFVVVVLLILIVPGSTVERGRRKACIEASGMMILAVDRITEVCIKRDVVLFTSRAP